MLEFKEVEMSRNGRGGYLVDLYLANHREMI